MGKPTGFMEFAQEMPSRRPVAERVGDYKEFYEPYPEEKLKNPVSYTHLRAHET